MYFYKNFIYEFYKNNMWFWFVQSRIYNEFACDIGNNNDTQQRL